MFHLSSENSSETVSKVYQFLTSSVLHGRGEQQYSSTYSNFGTIWGDEW